MTPAMTISEKTSFTTYLLTGAITFYMFYRYKSTYKDFLRFWIREESSNETQFKDFFEIFFWIVGYVATSVLPLVTYFSYQQNLFLNDDSKVSLIMQYWAILGVFISFVLAFYTKTFHILISRLYEHKLKLLGREVGKIKHKNEVPSDECIRVYLKFVKMSKNITKFYRLIGPSLVASHFSVFNLIVNSLSFIIATQGSNTEIITQEIYPYSIHLLTIYFGGKIAENIEKKVSSSFE